MNRHQKMLAAAALLALLAGGAAWYGLAHHDTPIASAALRLVGKAPTNMGWKASIDTVAAGFDDPYGIAIDRTGLIYVADAGEHNRIRRVSADGVVTDLAGGTEGFADGSGAAARLHTPSGIALDGQGNLIVADTGNHAIRRITPQGVVSTVAGSGSPGYADGVGALAQFNGPIGVAVDQAGAIYVADTYNDRIRRIAPDGTVSTVAGSGTAGHLDGSGAQAMFDTPVAIVAAPQGVLFVADVRSGAIRRIAPDGQVSTLAQTVPDVDDPLLRRPIALALTHDGYLYVGDMARGRILQLSPSGQLGGLTGIGIDIDIGDVRATRLTRPAGLALDRHGALLVADASVGMVRRLTPRATGQGEAPAVLAAAPAPGAPVPGGPTPGAPTPGAPTPGGPTPGAPAPGAPMPGAPTPGAPAPGAPTPGAPFPWPLAPQGRPHEVVGVVGEARGSYDGEALHHFHNGLDVQGAMGVPVLAVAREKVSSPLAVSGVNSVGEGIGFDSFTYYHLRVGRTAKNAPLDPARFLIVSDEKGRPEQVRVRRGARFDVGDPLGTVNSMFHVHLVYQTAGSVANAQMLPFPGFADSVIPRIDAITLQDGAGNTLKERRERRLVVTRGGGPLSIVVEAYDQADGNAARRKLGLYKVGYQLLTADGVPLAGFEKPVVNIEFNQLPPDRESVQVAYAKDSGITVYGSARTRFLYVATNVVRDGVARRGSWNPAQLAPGDYTIRILAADYAGNEALAGRDLQITVTES